MPRKIPGVWGQSPQGAWDRIRKLSDFRIGSLAFPLDGRSPPANGPGGEGGPSGFFKASYFRRNQRHCSPRAKIRLPGSKRPGSGCLRMVSGAKARGIGFQPVRFEQKRTGWKPIPREQVFVQPHERPHQSAQVYFGDINDTVRKRRSLVSPAANGEEHAPVPPLQKSTIITQQSSIRPSRCARSVCTWSAEPRHVG